MKNHSKLFGMLFLASWGFADPFEYRACTDNSFAYQRLFVEAPSAATPIIKMSGVLGGFHRDFSPVLQNESHRAGIEVRLSNVGKCDASPKDPNLFVCVDSKAHVKAKMSASVGIGQTAEWKDVKIRLHTTKLEDHFLYGDYKEVRSYFASLTVWTNVSGKPFELFQLNRLECQDTPLPYEGGNRKGIVARETEKP